MENKLELAKRFKKISIKKLLEIYDKRHSRFLDPYIDEKEPRVIRDWKVIKGGSGRDEVVPDPESGIQNSEAINDDIAA